MKLNDSDVGFHSRGVQSSNSYRVAQSAKVMDMFSNMLYSNKVRAVIRELSTNAWDAHLMAGNNSEAPHIFLPTHADPEFCIRDYGVGMSKEQLEEMYQTYGASNKSHSNDFNGCMGIGSKSPFAYANMFTTVSYYNGKKYVYVNAKDKSGLPTIKLMSETDTTERNGLEISFAVSKGDVGEFSTEAGSVLRWFPVRFVIKRSLSSFAFEKSNYVVEKDSWKIREYSYYDRQSVAVMGNVAYPIDTDKFDYKDEDIKDKTQWYSHYSSGKAGKTKRFYTDLLNLGLELHFETGTVEMDISREGLQYTKQTIDSIRSMLDTISREISDEMTKDISDSDCLWNAAIKMKELTSGSYRSLRQFIDFKSITYDNKEVPTHFTPSKNNSYSLIQFVKDRYSQKPTRYDSVTTIDLDGGTHFLIGDKKVGCYVATERFIANNVKPDGSPTYRQVYLVNPTDPTDPISVKAAVNAVKKDFSCLDSHISFASSVPVPKGVSKKGSTEKLFKFEVSTSQWSHRNGKQYWAKEDIQFDDGGYYVELNNWYTTNVSKKNLQDSDKHAFSSNELNDLVKVMKSFGITVPEISGVKTISIKRFNNDAGWTNFFDYAHAELKKYIANSNVKDQVKQVDNFRSWDQREFYSELCKKITEKQKESGTILHETLDKIKEMDKIEKKWGEKISKIRKVCTKMSIEFDSTSKAKQVDWLNIENEIVDTYPVVNLIGRWDFSYQTKVDSIVKVVNLIDACNS